MQKILFAPILMNLFLHMFQKILRKWKKMAKIKNMTTNFRQNFFNNYFFLESSETYAKKNLIKIGEKQNLVKNSSKNFLC